MTLVIGVGREGRGDDAAGLRAARLVRALLWPRVRMIECAGETTALIEAWRDESTVILIDALSSGAPPGTVRRFDASGDPLPAEFSRASTHMLGLAEAIELGRSLGRLPRSLVLYGIEGKSFAPGVRLSYPVECALREAALRITEEILAGGLEPPRRHTGGTRA